MEGKSVKNIETVAVVGLGYIGLPTAVILASRGVQVTGIDVKQSTVDAVNRGEVPFVEPDLAEYLEKVVSAGKLSAALTPPPADAFIVAVPTPFAQDHKADLSYIEAAADAISPQLQGGELLILESTSPPGATEIMAERVYAKRPELRDLTGEQALLFAHCPERVLPGRVMVELVENDRIVGGLSHEAALAAKKLYETFCAGEILLTDAKTAEMAKLVENSFRDVNIAFANELSVICDKLGINVWELIELANHHPRVNILQPGPGVGGHCIAVDPWFIVSATPDEARIIRAAREINDSKPELVITQVSQKAARLKDPVIAALGLAFKPDIDDLRESPALSITQQLAQRLPEAKVLAVEPNIEALPAKLEGLANVELAETLVAVEKADIVVLLVDHKEFKEFDTEKLADKVVIDTRGIWSR